MGFNLPTAEFLAWEAWTHEIAEPHRDELGQLFIPVLFQTGHELKFAFKVFSAAHADQLGQTMFEVKRRYERATSAPVRPTVNVVA